MPLKAEDYEDAMREQNSSARRWRVEGVFPAAGVIMLAGDPYVGKSRLLAALIAAAEAAIDRGAEPAFAGRRLEISDILHRGALLLALEHTRASWQALLRGAVVGAGVDRLHLQICRPDPVLDLTDQQDYDQLAALVERTDPWLIGVDPLRGAHAADENSSGEVREISSRLSRLAGDRRLVVAVHHHGATGRVRGSSDWSAAVDGVLEQSRRGERINIEGPIHDAPDVRLDLRMVEVDGGGYRFEPAKGGQPDDPDEKRRRDCIWQALDGGARLSTEKLQEAAREVARKAGAKRGHGLGRDRQILDSAKAMAAEGLIAEEGEGVSHGWRRCSP